LPLGQPGPSTALATGAAGLGDAAGLGGAGGIAGLAGGAAGSGDGVAAGLGAGAAAAPGAGGYPFMPPMGGMGGLGGQGGNADKERERATWLAEDDEVWGTDPECSPAVVGRDDLPETAQRPDRQTTGPRTTGSPYGPAHGGSRRARG
jgi:hypothetical protein